MFKQATAVVGLQYGDEAKSKIVDWLSPYFDIVCRFNGGCNAGHTVYHKGKKWKLHIVPVGVFENKTLIIGPECLIDIEKLEEEIIELHSEGYTPQLFLDASATLVTKDHIFADSFLKTGPIKTTGCGIGQASAGRCERSALRIIDLLRWSTCKWAKPDWCTFASFSEKILKRLMLQEMVHICDTSCIVNSSLNDGKRILFEGAQSIGLDNIHGEYPYVSQRCMPGGILTSFGMHKALRDMYVLGVIKPYVTRSGSGPMPTEMCDSMAELFRSSGGEYGVTTGRPRRIGWFDSPQVRRSARLAGCDGVAIAKVDIFEKLTPGVICDKYLSDDGSIFNELGPGARWKNIMPFYEEVGYDFIEKIEKSIGYKIMTVSYGCNRESTKMLKDDGVK